MHVRQICFGAVLALGLPALQAGAATLQVFGGPVGGGCNNFICYSGAPTSGTLRTTNATLNGAANTAFLNFNGSVTGSGLFAAFSLYGFPVNRGNLTLSSTDVFTIGEIRPGGPTTADITVRLRTSGQFGASNLGPSGQVATPSARGILALTGGAATVLDETRRDVIVRPDLNLGSAVVNVGVVFAPELELRVVVGEAFTLSTSLSMAIGISGDSDRAIGGAAFGNSALISFDLPEGYFITSERGYSQGLSVDPVDPTNPPVITLPAGGALLLSAFGLMGWASWRRRHTLAA
ncbi:MAG: hypothetical protein ACXIU8_12065 [Alkalilacustris sp.]